MKNDKKYTNYEYEKINPFEILGIKEGEKYPNYRQIENFRKQIKNKKQYLSCFILDNKFQKVGNFFIIPKDHFYYIIMDDIDNFKKIYENNKYILSEKDNKGRTLLHLSVIGGYYNISKFLLEKGINFDEPDVTNYYMDRPRTALYYADDNIKPLLKKFGAVIEIYNMSYELCNKGIVINSGNRNIIDSLYKILLAKGIVENKIEIKKNGEIIGKRFIRSEKLKYDYFKSPNEINKWDKVYHGTKYVSIEFILSYGLHEFGEPLKNHIPLGEKVNNIDNWASAIFVSPSIFYASQYSEIINSENDEWLIIIEAKVKPNSYSIHKNTLYMYKFKENESENVEYRINGDGGRELYDHNMSDVNEIVTTSLLFIKKKFIENAKNYSESLLF